MIAVMHASHMNPRVKNVTDILEARGVPYVIYGLDNRWRGFAQKLMTARTAACALTDHHYILFIDAHDVIVLAGVEALVRRFEAQGHPWVCAAEPNIWPPNSFRPEEYPPSSSPWRYLNSGCYMAEREYMVECFARWEPIEYGVDDQQWLADKYINDPGSIKLDTGCHLFQCLIGGWEHFTIHGDTFYNEMTMTAPLVLHHNGGGDISEERLRPLWP